MRLGRLTALRRADGGIRGIVASDVVRRLVSFFVSDLWKSITLCLGGRKCGAQHCTRGRRRTRGPHDAVVLLGNNMRHSWRSKTNWGPTRECSRFWMMCIVTSPNRLLAVHTILQAELWRHSRIHLECIRFVSRRVRHFRGDGPTKTHGIQVWGTPVGNEDFVRDHLRHTTEDHMSSLEKTPSLPDVWSALVLLPHCTTAWTN